MQMWNQAVDAQQEQDSHPEPDDSREKRPDSHGRRLLHGRNQKTPDGCRRHYAGRKPGENPLHLQVHIFFQEKDHPGAEGRSNQRQQQSDTHLMHFSHSSLLLYLYVYTHGDVK